jgi:hypothetical protein
MSSAPQQVRRSDRYVMIVLIALELSSTSRHGEWKSNGCGTRQFRFSRNDLVHRWVHLHTDLLGKYFFLFVMLYPVNLYAHMYLIFSGLAVACRLNPKVIVIVFGAR